ncbi:hypothetical protein [Nocardia farcinica]|uniref:hypothetical protein n=1 Tax=Nocardia farcinica TaxID=37329 RepID=UPI003CC803E9
MLDQPPPNPTSATRAPGLLSRSVIVVTSPKAAASRCRNQGRFMSDCASRMSVPNSAQLTPPPVRYASSSAGSWTAAAANIRASGAR